MLFRSVRPEAVPDAMTPTPEKPRYWFLAKTYGWGWGPPSTWEGWVVLVSFIVLLSAASFLFPPNKSMLGFTASFLSLTTLVLAICWWKGEPPRWRWGKE